MAARSDSKAEPGGFTCCVPNCYNNSKKFKGKLSFYVFPKEENIRQAWIRNISREAEFIPNSGHRVCSVHFKEGRKTYLDNVPTIFPGTSEKVIGIAEGDGVAETGQAEQVAHQLGDAEQVEQQQLPQAELEQEINEIEQAGKRQEIQLELAEQVENVGEVGQGGQQQQIEQIAQVQEVSVYELKLRIAELEKENQALRHTLSFEKVGVERYALSDSDISYYTSFANYEQFKAFYAFLAGDAGLCSRLNYWGSNNSLVQSVSIDKRGRKRTLLSIDELFLTLTRLRINLPEKVLADQFHLSVSEVSRIFFTWIDFLYTRLIQLPIWASRQTVDRTMPECFKSLYPSTIVILDCTEIFIERPSCFRVQAETYSTYKSHNTAKGLVGISPNGAVTFVSELYGGHASDREIVKASGIVDLVQPGDSVMADKGFEVQDLLVSRKVVLNIPPFMRCKDQLDLDEEEETREIAAVRIHVERAIARIKNFNILKFILPNTMASDINKIWKVCAILTNFKGPLVV